MLLGQYAPPGVLVNDDLDILHSAAGPGPTSSRPRASRALNLLRMAREGLLTDLRPRRGVSPAGRARDPAGRARPR